MRNFIGKKNSFGIEYEIRSVNSYVFGKVRLWLEGKYVGAFDDIYILTDTSCYLDGEDLRLGNECQFFVNEKADKIFELILSDAIPDSDSYRFSPGIPFDDFTIRCYKSNDKLHFVWKLSDKPNLNYPDYPKEVQSAVISVDEYREVV
ncbi:MAG: immunity 42 family protein, partial [Azoarcus sp.]|nr:immunity 42 family protein [Azoarcus sp.]